MSANVETMFYAGEKPWHGLGTKVNEALTSEQALIMAGLDWNVIQKTIQVEGITVPNYVANVRDSDNSVLGIVTEKYSIMQNKPAFAFTDALLNFDVKYETAGSLHKGRRVWLLAKMPDIFVLDDKVEPYLVFTNCHDGTGAVKVAITPIRVVCQNTLNMALSGAKRSWSTKHMGNMEYKLEEAKSTLQLANKYLEVFKNDAAVLANKIVSDAEFNEITEQLFPMPSKKDESDRKIDNINYLRNGLIKAYGSPNIDKFRGTKWGVMNCISDFATHLIPLRISTGYKENLFAKIVDGHNLIDEAYQMIKVA